MNCFQEIHLQEALEKKSTIPTPEIILIDEDVYDKMYPAVFHTPPNGRIKTIRKIRNTQKLLAYRFYISSADDGKVIDYDVDSEDWEWIRKQPQCWKLSADDLEQAIEFLEINSIRRVPSIEFLITQPFMKQKSMDAIEAIYDYWIDKKFKAIKAKTKLWFHLKRQEEKQKSSRSLRGIINEDPYIAFRQCPEKMHTRRNRAMDQLNYFKMLELRRGMMRTVKTVKTMALEEQAKRDMLKLKTKLFEYQYRNRAFHDDVFMPPIERPASLMDFNMTCHQKDDDDRIEEISVGIEMDDFELKRRAGCEYLNVS